MTLQEITFKTSKKKLGFASSLKDSNGPYNFELSHHRKRRGQKQKKKKEKRSSVKDFVKAHESFFLFECTRTHTHTR